MIDLRSRWPVGRSDNSEDYRLAFIAHVHQLIRLGYDRMESGDYQLAQEEEITGDLRKAVQEALDSRDAEDWTENFFVQEDESVDDPSRKGRRRRRVDIGFECSERRPRLRFRFEAKRLRKGHPLTGDRGYLGVGGLGCFLCGHYARDDRDAGMLGYVQSDSPEVWAERIVAALSTNPQEYEVCPGGEFAYFEVVPGLNHAYYSCHNRPAVGNSISIFHTLLQFN